MSTHPRDYAQVDACVSTLHEQSYLAVPCYGIHPWFLHEVLALDEEEVGNYNSNSGAIEGDGNKDDDWLTELRQRLIDHPTAIVGEIGLDGARWRAAPGDDIDGSNTNNPDKNAAWKYQKRMLSCPMNLQRQAFEQQLVVATELNRPVSIHAVQAWGELLDSLSNVRELMREKYEMIDDGICDDDVIDDTADHIVDEQYSSIRRKKKKQSKNRLLLPPKIYFHAFSGKAGILPSLLAAIEKGNVSRDDVYFGFAPVSDVKLFIPALSISRFITEIDAQTRL
jgi:Tat protein secretion system quality control protein TatD with DNase activity